MAECDEAPEMYFPDSNGEFAWDKPCWNDDWEYEYLNTGYKNVQEWNSEGRVIKKGEKGIPLPCGNKVVFIEPQTTESKYSSEMGGIDSDTVQHFETFDQAKSWAQQNPGKILTRSPDGNGFIVKMKK